MNLRPAFFVQNNLVERLTAPVAIFARQQGIALEDRSSSTDFDPDACGIDWSRFNVVLPYGSVQFVRKLKQSSLARFVLHDEERFATSSWAPALGPDALNGRGRLLSALAVTKALRGGGPMHVRPDRVDKAFAGAVLTDASWAKLRAERNIQDDLACWASPPAPIEAEWRCWIVGGEVVEVSQYRKDSQMLVRREDSRRVWSVAESLAKHDLPAPCVVVDLAYTEGRYAVVEFNPIHCSGWYAADVRIVLSTLLAWAVRRWGGA